MKKIGIITFQKSHGNYGASLQCFALWKYLDNKGFKSEVIDLLRPEHDQYKESKKFKWNFNKPSIFKIYLSKLKLFVLSCIGGTKSNVKYSQTRLKRFKDFNSQIEYSKCYSCIDDLYNNPPIYDIYITGSDQVWNPNIGFYIEPYFLTFVKDGFRKISYASSIALNDLPVQFHEYYKTWLSDYNHLSVREIKGKQIIDSLISKQISVVLDPTFLIDHLYWKNLAIRPNLSKKYLFVYTLIYNESLLNYAINKANSLNLELYCAMSIPVPNNYNSKITFLHDLGPAEWLGMISDAECFITDSFHGTIFSIMLGTPFYVNVSLEARSSRIQNLLAIFSLENHCLLNDFHEKGPMFFNHQECLKVLEKERIFSEEYLCKALTN